MTTAALYDVRTFIVGLSVTQCIPLWTCSTIESTLYCML